MNNNEYNAIGIDQQLDWERIRKLLVIGLFFASFHLVADFLLGWGTQDETLSGMERMFSAYGQLGNGAIYTAATMGMISIVMEGLSYFGVYRLMAERAPRYAHNLRIGILGYVIFCPFGFHFAVCMDVYLWQNLTDAADVIQGLESHFVTPGTVLFWIFFLILTVTQIRAFAKGMTPYPRWCWIFSAVVGMVAVKCVNIFGNHPLVNAIDCGWIAIGNIWMFGGLLLLSKKVERFERKNVL